jgi:4-amino-4-deoxy-L-arabinose transferase-like glycosyltransferase
MTPSRNAWAPQPAMATRAGSQASFWLAVLCGCALVYMLRLWSSSAAGASLHVDEAQYWDWSRDLQWGYYSKPSGIAALIAASCALFGQGEVGVRALAMLCYPLAAVVLAVLAQDMACMHCQSVARCPRRFGPGVSAGLVLSDDAGVARRAGLWAAAWFLASPVTALLGLVATTDAPLMLCWALGLLGLWWASGRRRPGGWALFALATGLGLLSKYTAAALWAGALLLVLLAHRRQWPALLLAGAGAALMLLPNLIWNSQHHWPTLQHTADITMHAGPRGAQGLLSMLLFVGAQLLLVAPLALPVWWLGRRERDAERRISRQPLLWLLCTGAPLALAGAIQAWRAGAQINWVAPLHLAAAVVAGLLLARAASRVQARVAWALGAQATVMLALTLAPHIASSAGLGWPAVLDPWARMRGWNHALHRVAEALPSGADVHVLGVTRAVMAHTAYHWRDRPIPRRAWVQPGASGHHYALRCPDDGARPPNAVKSQTWYVLSDEPLPPALLASFGPLPERLRVPLAITPTRQLSLSLYGPVRLSRAQNLQDCL